MARIAQVKKYNALVKRKGISRMYVMTANSGAMWEPERVRGWVVYEHRILGDPQDYAKLFRNKDEALDYWGTRC